MRRANLATRSQWLCQSLGSSFKIGAAQVNIQIRCAMCVNDVLQSCCRVHTVPDSISCRQEKPSSKYLVYCRHKITNDWLSMIAGLITIDSLTPLEGLLGGRPFRKSPYCVLRRPLSFSSKDRNLLYCSTNITRTDLLTISRIFLNIC